MTDSLSDGGGATETRPYYLLDGYVTDRILQSLWSGIIAADEKQSIIFVNQAALALTGRTVQQALGRSVKEVLGEEAALRAAQLEGPEEHRDIVFATGKGERREAGFNIVRVPGDRPSIAHCVFVFRDIGDRRQYELELRRVKGLTALGQMAAGFAHEVRNPLAALRSLNECLLAELPSDDPRREYSTRMAALVGRIESLVEHSLRYARPRPPQRQAKPPLAIVHTALDTLAPRIGAVHAIVVTTPETLPNVEVDDGQMVQVLVNLLENAIDSTGDPAHVKVCARECDTFVVIDVIDDGPGLSDAQMQVAFDPFFTTKAKGTGLGLAIAQRLMQDNGGHLYATSSPFERTAFSMHLPVHSGPADGPKRTTQRP